MVNEKHWFSKLGAKSSKRPKHTTKKGNENVSTLNTKLKTTGFQNLFEIIEIR